MAEEPENSTLALLRKLCADMTARLNRLDKKLGRVGDDLQNIKVGMTGTEEAVAGENRRLDRLEMRAGRIGKRLDLVEV